MNNPFESLDQRLSSIEEKLQLLHSQVINSQNLQANDELLTVPDAADFLKLSMSTIYGLVQKSLIPYSKRGKRLYFSKRELEAWIMDGRRDTIKEIAAKAKAHVSQVRKGGK